MKAPFTAQEEEIMGHITKAYELFLQLERQHPQEQFEFCNGVHAL